MSIKIVVDHMPQTAKDCPFADYIAMTSNNKCMLQQGMYSRCDLECGRQCCRLIEAKGESNEH